MEPPQIEVVAAVEPLTARGATLAGPAMRPLGTDIALFFGVLAWWSAS